MVKQGQGRPDFKRVSVRVPGRYSRLLLGVGDKLASAGGPLFALNLKRLSQGKPSIIPPPGARLHLLRVKWDKGRPWPEAINAAGSSNTPLIYRMGDQYPPEEGVGKEVIFLLNFPHGNDGWSMAIAWAEQSSLECTDPRQVFAIGEHHPNLHRKLGSNLMWVVATKHSSFACAHQACFVRWCGSEHWVDFARLDAFGGPTSWFAFCLPKS